ncbi:unnamed protein product [Didymodactylos carnosus]|uniref:Transmembrane protein n=2 Tax=Didymodactylos carnosus TaxID=1234261 RepID=A0A815V5B3_9BILA|nr:unnamed protein product [Didymodactylos carnosus]CAF4382484.1 unnamed protein product [Didymodactylos carnosus]
MKVSSGFFSNSPFRENKDDHKRRLELQNAASLRAQYGIPNSFVLIFAFPGMKGYKWMSIICTFMTIFTILFLFFQIKTVIQEGGDILDQKYMENNVPPLVVYACTLITMAMCVVVIYMCKKIPMRFYCQETNGQIRYALLYQTVLGQLNKVEFDPTKYKILPCRRTFYVMERLFRTRRDIDIFRSKGQVIMQEKESQEKDAQMEDENEEKIIWETVVENQKKDNK